VLPGVIGLVQATEAIKVLLGIGEPLIGRLLTYDALGMRFREVRLRRDPNCPLCGTSPSITDLSIHREGGAGCSISPDGEQARTDGVGQAAAPVRSGG
jgi:sulfur-carrier protein adenylyltransferase/sulfurtransferase